MYRFSILTEGEKPRPRRPVVLYISDTTCPEYFSLMLGSDVPNFDETLRQRKQNDVTCMELVTDYLPFDCSN